MDVVSNAELLRETVEHADGIVLTHFIVSGDIERSPLLHRGTRRRNRPKQHETEIRCYIRDPDGHLIEVGQTTLASGWRPRS
jgi:hypothetical protein